MPTLLRPNTISIVRRGSGLGVSSTGDRVPAAASTLSSGLPAMLDVTTLRGAIEHEVEGQTLTSTHDLVLDAFGQPGFTLPAAGQTFVQGGVQYKVAANGFYALPDVAIADKIVDENGVEYLVLLVQCYFFASAGLQAQLAAGKAWKT